MNTTELTLKPCPFCGGDVRYEVGRFVPMWFFECKHCGAVVSFNNDYINTHTDKAVDAWNRRAEDGKGE